MQSPLILLIDDSATIRKMVEYHLTEAGYRVLLAVNAEAGLELAASRLPQLIILDHQLPGVTGDHVCQLLLESKATSKIPVLVSSTLRNRAFARYAEFPNVIDQLPKPFTADLLRSGVDNALQNGSMLVTAQSNGSAIPESVEPVHEATLEADLKAIPFNTLFRFLTDSRLTGRLIVESSGDCLKFAIANGMIQAVYSPTISPETLIDQLPEELREFAPMIPFTLAEQRNESMSSLLKLFESTLSHTSRLKALLRFQSSVLTFLAFRGEPSTFVFDSYKSLPPLFEALPLQASLASLLIEGVSHSTSRDDLNRSAPLIFGRVAHRFGIVGRPGLKPLESAVVSGLDGYRPVSEIAERLSQPIEQVAAVAIGLEMAGYFERRVGELASSVLLIEDRPEPAMTLNSLLDAKDGRFQIRRVRDRIAAKLLLKRSSFSLIIMSLNTSDDELYYRALKEATPPESRFLGIVESNDDHRIRTLLELGVDAVARQPLDETEFRTLVNGTLQHAVSSHA